MPVLDVGLRHRRHHRRHRARRGAGRLGGRASTAIATLLRSRPRAARRRRRAALRGRRRPRARRPGPLRRRHRGARAAVDRAPGDALARMAAATRPGGGSWSLDYSHADLVWEPEPPPPSGASTTPSSRGATANGWDNRLAHRLPDALRRRLPRRRRQRRGRGRAPGTAGFEDALAIWRQVMGTLGPTIVGRRRSSAGRSRGGAGAHRRVERARRPRNTWCCARPPAGDRSAPDLPVDRSSATEYGLGQRPITPSGGAPCSACRAPRR